MSTMRDEIVQFLNDWLLSMMYLNRYNTHMA
jgi:hypothetical protein